MEQEQEKNKISRSEIIGKGSQMASAGLQVHSIWKSIVPFSVLIIVLIFFIYKGLPWYIGAFFIAFFILLFVLDVVSLKRTIGVDLSAVPNVVQNQTFEYDPNESIAAYFVGIRGGKGLVRSVEILGKGEVFHPENAVIITSKRIIFVFVPMLGADKVVGGADISLYNLFLAKDEMLKKLEQMVGEMPLPDIFKSYPRNFYLNIQDISNVKFGRIFSSMTIKTNTKEKYRYSLFNKGDKVKLKEIFTQLGKI